MNRHLLLLTLCQGLFLVNNVTFIAINGLVGMRLAPVEWMATLPVMGYVVGGAIAAPLVARTQMRLGRRGSFQIGLLVALFSVLLAAFAAYIGSFGLLTVATVISGYYYANGQLYRFAAAELTHADWREKAVSVVLAGGILGGFVGPRLADWARELLATPFVGAYLTLALVAVLAMIIMACIHFPDPADTNTGNQSQGRPMTVIMRQPTFLVATFSAAAAYGVMNLLMAATPLAMQGYGYKFAATATILQWHVIGMYAPGFGTGHLIRKLGVKTVMGAGAVLMLACIVTALTGSDTVHFLVSLILLGIGWNLLFTGSTTLAMEAYRPEEKDRAQSAINFWVFITMAITSFASGAVVTTSGWVWLNMGSIPIVALVALALIWLGVKRNAEQSAALE